MLRISPTSQQHQIFDWHLLMYMFYMLVSFANLKYFNVVSSGFTAKECNNLNKIA